MESVAQTAAPDNTARPANRQAKQRLEAQQLDPLAEQIHAVDQRLGRIPQTAIYQPSPAQLSDARARAAVAIGAGDGVYQGLADGSAALEIMKLFAADPSFGPLTLLQASAIAKVARIGYAAAMERLVQS